MPETRSKVEQLSAFLWFASCVFQCRADGMFWRLSAYWQASDTNANSRSNLATSLFTLGIKLKNTASNFIPGFLYHRSAMWHLLASMMPFLSSSPFDSLSLSLDNTLCSKQGSEQKMMLASHRMKIWAICFAWDYTWNHSLSPTIGDWTISPLPETNSLFSPGFYCLYYQSDLHY